MKQPTHPLLRKALREHEQGLSAIQLANAYNLNPKTVRRALEHMPDTYIDRWRKASRGQYEAVWCAVRVPANCPHPKDRFVERTQWRHRGIEWTH